MHACCAVKSPTFCALHEHRLRRVQCDRYREPSRVSGAVWEICQPAAGTPQLADSMVSFCLGYSLLAAKIAKLTRQTRTGGSDRRTRSGESGIALYALELDHSVFTSC